MIFFRYDLQPLGVITMLVCDEYCLNVVQGRADGAKAVLYGAGADARVDENFGVF